MVTETNFNSLFDYRSAFKYDSIVPVSKGVSNSSYKSAFTYHSVNIESDSDIDRKIEEHWVSSILRSGITVLAYFLIIMSFPLSIWICVKKVHALERIVLMRLGRLQAVRGPGFALVLPVIDTWARVDLKPQTFTVSTSQLLTADRGIIELKSDIEYQVCDVTNYVMKLNEPQETLEQLSIFCLKNLVSQKDQDDLENRTEWISSSVKNELNQSCLKWGLEVLNVHLYSLNVLKQAEPIDALGTLMIALKAATGDSSKHMPAVYPVIPDDNTLEKTSAPKESYTTDVVDILKKAIEDAEGKGLLKDVTANCKVDIVGNSTQTLYIIFENGHATISKQKVISDVSLVMSEANLQDFLCGKMSPLYAYMEGKVRVTGDWSLLQPIANILERSMFIQD